WPAGQDKLMLLGRTKIDSQQNRLGLREDGVVRTGIQEAVANLRSPGAGQSDRQDGTTSDGDATEGRNGPPDRKRSVRDSHARASPPPRMISSGSGTNATRISDVPWPASFRAASSRSSSSSLARIRVPSGLHATYLPAYGSNCSGGKASRF